MASTSSRSPLLYSFIFTIAVVITTISATEFQVGGSVGWRIPATNESQLYNVWASRRRFHIGDSLHFRYKNDSVTVVEKWGFYHCDSSNPIAFFNDGDTVIDLNNIGTMYFISGDSDRCKQGVSMMVEVMSPVPVRYFPPAISAPPEGSFSDVAPSPAQVMSSGDEPEASPGPDSSDSVSVSGIAVVLGLGFAVLSL
ncbi:putative Phytocyanin domain, cupredoxin [Helianthus annuus]|nr:putative Phytocyanin domain, cupredoxin [Helianthus annuus]KAJ0504368.1 putative Phytocyanin domain, cupredoxin [Helianthus annuus]